MTAVTALAPSLCDFQELAPTGTLIPKFHAFVPPFHEMQAL